MQAQLAAIDKLAARLKDEAAKYKALHDDSPDAWSPISDLGTLINEVTEALDNNSLPDKQQPAADGQ